jgi:excisionase family DNA binding protein
MFAVSVKTVSRWAQLGLLPAIRTPGGRLRFRRRDVEEFLRKQGEP